MARATTCRIKKSLFRDLPFVPCCFCGILVSIFPPDDYHQATIEHIIPKILGGSELNRNNMAISCCYCNNERQTADFFEFRRFKQGIITKIPRGASNNLIRRHTSSYKKFTRERIINHQKHRVQLSDKDKYVYSD